MTRPTYRYADRYSTNGPCKSVTLTDGKALSVTCLARRRPLSYSLDEPSQGAVAVRLTIGDSTWCAVFGGRVQRDSGTDPPVPDGSGRFQAKDAPAGECPAAPAPCP